MPVLGTLDIRQWAAGGISVFEGQDDEAWVLKNAEVLNLAVEIQPHA
jgi:hypothetical protein